jgi:hypothetical protein
MDGARMFGARKSYGGRSQTKILYQKQPGDMLLYVE